MSTSPSPQTAGSTQPQLTRRDFLERTATLAAAAALPAGLRASPAGKAPPNIVFLIADDHRRDALGCMGNPIIRTPALDQLARDGVIFDRHFCTTPICCASRASIMLSQYAGTHGIFDFWTNLTPAQIQQTYWGRLKQAGYHLGFIGKFGVGDKLPAQEFDYWKGFPAQGFYFPDGPQGRHLTDIQRDQANDFLGTVPHDRPFCLSLSFKAPHIQDDDPKQYLPSAETLPLYEGVEIPAPKGAGPDDIHRFPAAIQHSETRRRWGITFSTPALYQASMKGYYRLVSGIDRAVESIRQTLKLQGLADNTIIIYSADHGVFHGEHGFAEKWYGHEESIGIPLIIYDPRSPAPERGQRRQAMTLNIDLAPTILDLAQVPIPESMQGRSLAPLLKRADPSPRRVMFFEHHLYLPSTLVSLGGTPPPTTAAAKTTLTQYPWIPSSEGIRTETWKYIRYTDDAAPFEELYHLPDDPAETHNLAGRPEFAEQQRALTAYCNRWKDSLGGNGGVWREPIGEDDLRKDRFI